MCPTLTPSKKVVESVDEEPEVVGYIQRRELDVVDTLLNSLTLAPNLAPDEVALKVTTVVVDMLRGATPPRELIRDVVIKQLSVLDMVYRFDEPTDILVSAMVDTVESVLKTFHTFRNADVS